jgi:hypothetical protein
MRSPLFVRFALPASFLLFLAVHSAAAQDQTSPEPAKPAADSAKAAASAPAPQPEHVETNLAGFKLSGYGEASFQYSTKDNAGAITGHLYDRFHDQFSLDALKLVIDRPYAADKLDGGVHADLLFGQDAAVVQSGGLNLGPNGDITQLYVTLNIPTSNGNGVQIKAGKMVTLMGLEVIETISNPTWSEGTQFIYAENFTATGVSLEYKFSPHFDTQLRVINGWDLVSDNNTRKSFMGRFGIYPDASTSIGVVGFVGPEQPEAVDPSHANRYGVDLLLSRKFGGRTTIWVQGDYGKEKANPGLPDPTRDAEWYAGGAWISYDASPKLNIALRGDYMDDKEGARTDGAYGLAGGTRQKLATGTVTFNIKAWPNVLVRPEARYDHSDQAVFSGEKSQVVLALSTAYMF